MGSTRTSILETLRNANAPIGVVTSRQTRRREQKRIGADKGAKPDPTTPHGISPMSPREPQLTPPPTFVINSSRDMLEKLKREIERLAGSIIRQEIVDHGLNAAMTAWHLTEWTWREIQGSIPRIRSVTEKAGTSIRELKQFQQFVKRDCAELAYCEGIAISTKHFTFLKLPVFSTKVTERFKINPDPIGKDGGATQHQCRQPARPLPIRRRPLSYGLPMEGH